MHLAVTICTIATVVSSAVAAQPGALRRSLEASVPAVQPFDGPSSAALLAEPMTPAEAAGDVPEDVLQLSATHGRQPASVGRTVAYTLSMMAVSYGVLVLAGEVDDPDLDTFRDSISSAPETDDDDWEYNYLLHPLWGSETYLRAREADFGIAGSIGYSMASSLVWEYLVEGWSEHPSTQDLLLTTGVGWLLGEARYTLKQRTKRKYHWLIDPIVTGLAHIGIRLTRESGGEVVTVVSWRWTVDS